ncbi:MAG: ELM1/GtrOC1 family putative glycosyltransferase [Candidatus Omnitrophota bacterium]
MKIVVLDDGNRGNFNQAVGIAERIPSAEIEVITIPSLGVLPRLILILTANLTPLLSLSSIRFLLKSLVFTENELVPKCPKPCLVISAGGRLSSINLLLSRAFLADSIQVLWPDLIRLSLFDLIVIPEHDLWRHRRDVPAPNMMVIKGATNRIKPSGLINQAPTLMVGNPQFDIGDPAPTDSVGRGRIYPTRIAVLIGGNDKNYVVSKNWAQELATRLIEIAENLPAEVYITTSRRTPKEVEQALRGKLGDSARFHLVLYRETRANPVTEFLAKADIILTTEDSINMVSESAGSGRRTVVLRVERRRKRPLVFDRALQDLSEEGYINVITLEELTREMVSDLVKIMPEKVLAETERVSQKAGTLLREEKILVVGVSCLGDSLILSPAYRAIRLNFPMAGIDIITDRRSAGYFENHPYFRKIFYYDKKSGKGEKESFLKSIQQERYSLIFDFRQSIFGIRSGAKRKANFYLRTCFGPKGTTPKEGEHEADRWQRLLGYFLPLPDDKTLYFPENNIDHAWLEETFLRFSLEKYNYVVLNPGARWDKKRWSPEGFARLTELIWQKYRLPSVIVGDKDEVPFAEQLVQFLSIKFINLSGQTTLAQLVALLSGAKLLVSNDTGTVHLASAVKCPVAVLFGPGDWRRYGPYQTPYRIISSGFPCSPCLKTDCPTGFSCWKEITPAKVLTEINIFLVNTQMNPTAT